VGAPGRTGTVGLFVRTTDGVESLLSSSHVLNRKPDGRSWPVQQPGGRAARANDPPVAWSSTWVRLSLNAPNRTEAALARMVPDVAVDPVHPLGRLTGVCETITVGMRLRKVGRTTGRVEGRVAVVDWHGPVRIGRLIAPFAGQLLIEGTGRQPVSLDGDSGSVWVTEHGEAAAINFAGLRRGRVSISTPIVRVLHKLGVEPVFDRAREGVGVE
jgi:hypothetical protein